MGKRPRGAEPHWVPSTAAQVGILADVITAYVEHYANDTLRRGGRGIFYDLRPAGREPEARLRAIRELGRLLGRRYRGYALEVLRAEMARDEHRTSYRKPDSTYPLTRPVLDADGRPLKTA